MQHIKASRDAGSGSGWGNLGSWPALVLARSPGNWGPAGSKPMPCTLSCQTTLVQAAVSCPEPLLTPAGPDQGVMPSDMSHLPIYLFLLLKNAIMTKIKLLQGKSSVSAKMLIKNASALKLLDA